MFVIIIYFSGEEVFKKRRERKKNIFLFSLSSLLVYFANNTFAVVLPCLFSPFFLLVSHRGEGLSKTAIGDYLGEKSPFHEQVLKAFVDLHDFTDLIIVQALR